MSSTNNRGLSLGCQVVNYGNVEKTIERAVRAETAEFDAVAVPDRLFHLTGPEEYLVDPPQEVFSVLGATVQRTEEAILMPGVADSVCRHPTKLARATITLDRMTNGRAGPSIGTGGVFNFAPISDIDWDDPYTRFREYVAVIDGPWNPTTDGLFSFADGYFDLDEAHMRLNSAQEPCSSLWIGGCGESMCGLTNVVADGWSLWICSLDEYMADLRKVLDVIADRSRDSDAADHAVMAPTAASEDGDETCAAGIGYNRMNLTLRSSFLAGMGYEDIAESAPIM